MPSAPASPPTRRRVWLAIVTSGAGWGSEGVATRAAFNAGAGPYAVATLRAFVAAFAIVAWAAAGRRRVMLNAVILKQGIVQGGAHLAIPYVLLTIAYQHASAGYVALIVTLIPVTMAILAHIFLEGERMSTTLSWGFALAFAGAAFMLISGDSGLAEEGRPALAAVLTLGAVAAISVSAIYAKRDAHRYDVFSLTVVQMIIGAIMLTLLMPLTSGSLGDLILRSWLLISFLAVFATVIPYMAFFWSLQHASATLAALSGYVSPMVAVVAGVVLLDEQLQPGIVIGGLLILAGVFAANRAEAKVAAKAHL